MLQAVGGGVAEILPHTAVEMDIYQAGDDIAPGSVQNLAVAAGLGNQPAVGIQVPADKALIQVKDLAV